MDQDVLTKIEIDRPRSEVADYVFLKISGRREACPLNTSSPMG